MPTSQRSQASKTREQDPSSKIHWFERLNCDGFLEVAQAGSTNGRGENRFSANTTANTTRTKQ